MICARLMVTLPCRYEAQLQMQRLRLASDKDCAQEQVQVALTKEHKQHRAVVDRLEQVRWFSSFLDCMQVKHVALFQSCNGLLPVQ